MSVLLSPVTAGGAALSLVDISRRFGTVQALDRAKLHVAPGSVHALLGENGAGKTTLMRVAFGLVQADSGSMFMLGKPARFTSPTEALTAGMGMVHQHFTLVPAMTVAENVALGRRGLYSVRAWRDRVREIGERTGLSLDPDARIADLSIGAQQRCEIVKALARDVRVLILDEPTAVLAPTEAQELLRWTREFANAGHAVVLITHKLRDAMSIADSITVLRRGRSVLSARVRETNEDALAAAMLGAGASDVTTDASMRVALTNVALTNVALTNVAMTNVAVTDNAANAHAGESVPVPGPSLQTNATNAPSALRLRNVTVRDRQNVARVEGASLEVRRGEIVGVAAVEGSGQRELLRVLAGRMVPTSGEALLPDGVGFVPEDRHADALLLDRSLVENVALRDAGARRGRMPWSLFAESARTIIAQFDVRASGADAEARTLSGGNQQKLVLGRELADHPDALIVENPTRGLDFRATAAVHASLREARDAGTAVVVYSSDLDEVLALANRVVVVYAGRLTEVALTAPDARAAIGRAMLGAR
ncbi:MAG: ABC transporter ATP-binding protein [Gemmatimonas sp.]